MPPERPAARDDVELERGADRVRVDRLAERDQDRRVDAHAAGQIRRRHARDRGRRDVDVGDDVDRPGRGARRDGDGLAHVGIVAVALRAAVPFGLEVGHGARRHPRVDRPRHHTGDAAVEWHHAHGVVAGRQAIEVVVPGFVGVVGGHGVLGRAAPVQQHADDERSRDRIPIAAARDPARDPAERGEQRRPRIGGGDRGLVVGLQARGERARLKHREHGGVGDPAVAQAQEVADLVGRDTLQIEAPARGPGGGGAEGRGRIEQDVGVDNLARQPDPVVERRALGEGQRGRDRQHVAREGVVVLEREQVDAVGGAGVGLGRDRVLDHLHVGAGDRRPGREAVAQGLQVAAVGDGGIAVLRQPEVEGARARRPRLDVAQGRRGVDAAVAVGVLSGRADARAGILRVADAVEVGVLVVLDDPEVVEDRMPGRGPGGRIHPEPLELVRQLRAPLPLVRELRDEQREWLGVSGNP